MTRLRKRHARGEAPECVATCGTEPVARGRTVDEVFFELANLPEPVQGRDVVVWEGAHVRAILTSDGTTIHVIRVST
jgi:hypothetical protein